MHELQYRTANGWTTIDKSADAGLLKRSMYDFFLDDVETYGYCNEDDYRIIDVHGGIIA